MNRRSVRGMTLIELVVAIVVVGIAISSVLGLLSSIAMRSAEAMVREQATYIAAAYLNEIQLKAFADPDVDGETARASFDDIDDYEGPADVVRDQFGTVINGLDQFRVLVDVTDGNAGVLGTVPAAEIRRIDVIVTHSTGMVIAVTGYRTDY